jgi:L-Ala-D/L-Glu epimerase
MTRIVSMDVVSLEIPFRRAFAHNLNTHKASRPQLVRIELSSGAVGWGEAQPRDYVTGENVASVHATVREVDAFWRGLDPGSLENTAVLLHAAPQRATAPAAFAGIELALLDAVGRDEGRNVTEVLGSVATDSISYDGAVLGFLPSSAFGMALMRCRKLGKNVVKLKVGREGDRERLIAARRILGNDVRLVLDANAAWASAAEAIANIESYRDLGIDAIEQPVAGDDIRGMAAVRAAVRLPIIADESLCTIDDARRLVAAEAADIFNVRIGKCGGLLASLEILDYARAHGIGTHLGVMVGETGIAGTAGRLLAACVPDIRHREFDSSGNAELDVLAEPLADITDNRAPIPPLRPGLGYEVDLVQMRSAMAA